MLTKNLSKRFGKKSLGKRNEKLDIGYFHNMLVVGEWFSGKLAYQITKFQ